MNMDMSRDFSEVLIVPLFDSDDAYNESEVSYSRSRNWNHSVERELGPEPQPPPSPLMYGLARVLLTSSILGLVILATIVGNVFVIAAIVLEKNLRSVANYLIASLAVADLMVCNTNYRLCSLFNLINHTKQVI